MTNNDTNNVRGEQTRNRDPTQLSLPDIDTSITVISRFSLGDLLFLSPAFGVIAFGIALYVIGFSPVVMAVTTGIGVLIALAGAGMVLMAHEYTSPQERLTAWKRYFLVRRSMPVSNTVAARFRQHGVRRVFDDGTAEMDDGTLVGMVRVEGRTTANMTYDELDPLVATLSKNIDQKVKNFGFKFYSTTREHDLEAVIAPYDERAYSGVLDRAEGYMGEFMRSLVEWFVEVDEPAHNPRDRRHYVAVRAEPDTDDPGFVERKDVQRTLYDRLETVERKMFAGIDGVEVARVGPEEHAEVLLAYWTGKHHEPDETMERKFNRGEDGPSVWPPSRIYKGGDREEGNVESGVGSADAQRHLRTAVPTNSLARGSDATLESGHFDAKRGYLEIGEQVAMVLWIADYPAEIESGFLKSLYDLEGVDIDVTFDATPVDKQQALEEVQEGELNIGAKSGEQAEIESRGTNEGRTVYGDAGDLLRNTNAQAWDVSGYVVVRVGPKHAIEAAEESHREFESFDAAKMGALLDAKARVEEVLESSPCEATVIKPERMQLELFESASPNKGNVYNDVLAEEGEPGFVEKRLESLLGDAGTSGPKQKRVLGGFLGAAFPPGSSTINEDGGLNWGRDVETGLPFRTNPSKRSTAPHMITLGVSRSGKTYGASSAMAAWYAERDDRTLIVCDTQGGFAGLTRMLGGRHLVLEGTRTINPLDIQAPPEGHEDVDAFRMSVNSATNFFRSILKSQGVDDSEYHSVIEQGIEKTYRDFGIVPGDVDADEKPTVEDLLETWKEMGDNPAKFTVSGEGSKEEEIKETHVAELLDKLSGFSPNGKYHNLLGETSLGLTDSDVDMAYIDLSQLETDNDAEESAMMSLAQAQVTQKVRRCEGELLFVVDEAHQLLHSDEQVSWLQKGAREWARYGAIMWFISQHPSEFVAANSSDENSEKKQALLDQCSFTQIYNMPRVRDEVLREFVPNDALVDTIKTDLTAARERAGFTECVVNVTDNDKPGWHTVHVEASPFEDHVLNYSPSEHGDFDQYMQRFLHSDALAPVEHRFESETEDTEVTPEPATPGLADLYSRADTPDTPETTDDSDTGPARDEHGRFVSTEADD